MGKLPICFSKRLFWTIKWHAVCRDNMNSESFSTSSSVTHQTWDVSGNHGFGPWSQLLLQNQAFPPLLSPITSRTPVVFVRWMVGTLWHTGTWEDLWQRKCHPNIHPLNGTVGTKAFQLLSHGRSGNRDMTLWTRWSVMAENILMQLNGNFFFCLTVTD